MAPHVDTLKFSFNHLTMKPFFLVSQLARRPGPSPLLTKATCSITEAQLRGDYTPALQAPPNDSGADDAPAGKTIPRCHENIPPQASPPSGCLGNASGCQSRWSRSQSSKTWNTKRGGSAPLVTYAASKGGNMGVIDESVIHLVSEAGQVSLDGAGRMETR